MGLMIHSMGEVPANVDRAFYIYLLDYGWQEPIRDALFDNFQLLADHASKNDAVVFRVLLVIILPMRLFLGTVLMVWMVRMYYRQY